MEKRAIISDKKMDIDEGVLQSLLDLAVLVIGRWCETSRGYHKGAFYLLTLTPTVSGLDGGVGGV